MCLLSSVVRLFILSYLLLKIKNNFSPNSHVHTFNTRHNNNLFVPAANLTLYQKGVYYSGIKIFNRLPTTIKARVINHFKNTKRKLYRTNAAIWYNKTCKLKWLYGLNPSDVHILFLTVWIVPMAVDTVKIVLSDDGRVCRPKHVEWTCREIKLHCTLWHLLVIP